jgi:hypothetical protein
MTTDELIAKKFHEIYENLAPEFGYKTREESAKPWSEVPSQNRQLMIAVVHHLVVDGIILPGANVPYQMLRLINENLAKGKS